MQSFSPSAPFDDSFRSAIGSQIAAFLDRQLLQYDQLPKPVLELFELAARFTAGGKRIRPAFCYWSFVAATDKPPSEALLKAAASLDLLHVSALMHDDIIDASDLRRGLPAAHRHYETLHRQLNGVGSSEAFGRACGILLGDLLFGLSAEMFDTAGLDLAARERAASHLHAMRSEIAIGQCLDIWLQDLPPASPADQLSGAVQVTEYKTACYSVRRPCQIGCALAGGDPRLAQALDEFGAPLGRAFQLRDDLLGIFGDPAVTGKPAGDDLREGKRTVLVALTFANASASAATQLTEFLGNPDLSDQQVDLAREIIVDSGAEALAKQRITTEYDTALRALADVPMTDSGRIALQNLAELSVNRDN